MMHIIVSKNSSTRRSFALFLFLTASRVSTADHRELPVPSKATPLKLEALISEALEKNANLKASKQESVSREAESGPAGSYEDPMLAFEAMNYPVNSLSPREWGMTGNQISLTQRIPFPGKLSKKRRAAEYAATAQKEMTERKRLNLIRDVRLAYYELFATYKKYDSLNEQKGLFGQLVTVTRNNYAVGRVPQAEVLNLQVEQASLIDQMLLVEKQIRHKLGELNHLLGRADHSEYLYGRPEEIKKTPFDLKSLTEKAIVERALSRSPMIKEKQAQLSSAEANLSYSNWNYLPNFEFRIGYTQREQNLEDDGTDFVSGMIGISIPLWAGSKQSEEKRGATADKIRAEAIFDEERISLVHMVHVIYAELEEANKRVQLFEGGVLPLTKQAVVSGRSAYLTGKIEYSTLLSSINKRFQMETGYAEALSTYESKIAQLEALIGGSLGDTP